MKANLQNGSISGMGGGWGGEGDRGEIGRVRYYDE